MPETLRGLPKNAPERLAVAKQLRHIRDLDRRGSYVDFRTIDGYYNLFAGLDGTLQYLIELGSSNIILDIGTGKGTAITEIARTSLGSNFDFKGTTLAQNPSKQYDLPPEKVLRTSAELLHGIADQTIAGILACYSIAYSAAPEYVIRRIDEVLVPGGILKATFDDTLTHETSETAFENKLQTHHRFTAELHRLGYDILITEEASFPDIVLALKPGGPSTTTARMLMDHDKALYTASLRTVNHQL